MTDSDGPPRRLVRTLVEGPSVVSGLEWHPTAASTNALAGDAARRGVPEVHVVLADEQSAGRGRLGRSWQAPAGTSLLMSLVTRPAVPALQRPLLSLVTGLALAETVGRFCPSSTVGLKWPNDLLIDEGKAAGILVEGGAADAVIVGCGINVDWRDVERPADLAGATSVAEAAATDVDRWSLLAAFVEAFGGRYRQWCLRPVAFLGAYRELCTTIGQRVRVTRPDGSALVGKAVGVDVDGALLISPRVATGASRGADADAPSHAVRIAAGDVEHVRSA